MTRNVPRNVHKVLKISMLGATLLLAACFDQNGSIHDTLYRLAHSGEVRVGDMANGVQPVRYHSPAACAAFSDPEARVSATDYQRIKSLCQIAPAIAASPSRTSLF